MNEYLSESSEINIGHKKSKKNLSFFIEFLLIKFILKNPDILLTMMNVQPSKRFLHFQILTSRVSTIVLINLYSIT